ETAHAIANANARLAAAIAPADPHLLLLLGVAELRIGRAAQALASIKHAYDLTRAGYPDDGVLVVWAPVAYATALNGAGQPEAARQILEPLVAKLRPTELVPLHGDQAVAELASSYTELDRPADAAALIDTWLEPMEHRR